jgi:hypothetical protein
MSVAFSLRKVWFTALLVVAGALVLAAPTFASAGTTAWTSEHYAAAGHETCPESDMPMPAGIPSGVGVDCCHWTSAADSPGLPLPSGSDSASAPPRALVAIPSARAPALEATLHASAAAPDFIVLFGRFRE